jgi:hypothetical protein
MQAHNHSATKAFPSSHNPDPHSAYQHQKSFGSAIYFIASVKHVIQKTSFNRNTHQP